MSTPIACIPSLQDEHPFPNRFLVARLQMDALTNSNSVNHLFGTLDELPSGINEMYERTLTRINAQSAEDASIARRLFIWLMHAKEPIALSDLPYALAVSFDRLAYDPDDVVDTSIILSSCGGLVSVQKPRRWKVRFNDIIKVHWPDERVEIRRLVDGVQVVQYDDRAQVRFTRE